MSAVCDHKSVGIIIEDHSGNLLLIRRGRYPVGIAPVAGHIDNHGGPTQAAINEVREEIGLTIHADDLQATTIQNRDVGNRCRRLGGDHHHWWVYKTSSVEGELQLDKDEASDACWYSQGEVRELARRTQSLRDGSLTEEDFTEDPGLEPVWLDFLTELGYLTAA